MALVGPTDAALRYAINKKIPDLEAKIRFFLLTNMQLFLQSIVFEKYTENNYFGKIKLVFYIITYPVRMEVYLSKSDIPAFYIYTGEEFDSSNTIIFIGVNKLIKEWAFQNIPMIY
jgi:hypothetical protein